MKIRLDLGDEFFSQGFNEETDPFKREDLANRLTSLFSQLTQGTVSILNGRWGSGKSIFARQWKHQLESQGVPCIYFDAFAADYVESPFRAIASTFVKAARDARCHDVEAYAHFIDAATRATKAIAAPAAKMAAKAVTFGLLGSSEVDEWRATFEEIASGLGEISEASVKALLEGHADDEAAFAALRKSLSQLPSLLSKKLAASNGNLVEPCAGPRSLVVIIDELDRCRPDFSLGILEVLKHFFRTDHVHFVLVTNLSHLLLSVEKRYGVGDGAKEYAQKFYDFIIPFEQPNPRGRSTPASEHVSRILAKTFVGSNTQDGSKLIEWASRTVFAFNLSLRQAEQMASIVLMAKFDFTKDSFRPLQLIAILAAIKLQEPSLYENIRNGKAEFAKIQEFILSGAWPEETNLNHILDFFRYLSDPKIDGQSSEYEHFVGGLARYNIFDRQQALTYLTNSVLDRFG